MEATGTTMTNTVTGKMMGGEKTGHKEMKQGEGRMMTMQEIVHKLHENFSDEIADANEYLNMAESAERMEHHEMAEGLAEIAKEEYTHAKFIHYVMKENGIMADTEDMKDWEELEARFRRMFW